MNERCPKCHLAYIPEEIKTVWLVKFGVLEYPHYNTICNWCDKKAGDHIAPNWECPK